MTMMLRVMTGASIHCAIACSLNKLPYHDQPGPGKMPLRSRTAVSIELPGAVRHPNILRPVERRLPSR